MKCTSIKKVFHLTVVPSFPSLNGTDRAANLMKTRKRFPAGREDYLFRSSTYSGKSSVEGTKNCVLHVHSNPLVLFSQLGIPDRKSCSIYRHSCRYVAPPKGMVFGPFWLENGYTLCLFWSGIGYAFREKYVSV